MAGDDPRATGDATGSDDVRIRTFLIADMRGWTLFTQQRGDEAAGELAARFAGISREVVERGGGTLLELRGDEAMCVFSSARRAIRAAVDLQERFVEETLADPDLPLAVGIGLDAGEAVEVEGGYRGGALNLAARLCGQAKAGEILASRGVTHLARKVDGIRYLNKGTVRLKNLTDPVEIVRVVQEGVDPAERLRAALPHEPTRRASPTRIAVAAAVAAVLAVTTFVVLRDDPAPSIAAGSVGLLDASGRLQGTTDIGEPAGLAADGDALWITDRTSQTVARADRSTYSVTARIPVGTGPTGVAVGGGFVWVANTDDRTVSVVDPQVLRVVKTIVVGNGPAGIAFDGDRVWVANSVDGSVSEIDTSNFTVTETHRVGERPVALAVGGGAVWVVNQRSGTVSRVVSELGETEPLNVGRGPSGIAHRAGSLWVANTDDGTVSRIDVSTGRVSASEVGGSPVAVAVDEAGIWVANAGSGTIQRLDPGSALVAETLDVGNEPRALTQTDGGMWVGVQASPEAHSGGTLRIASELGPGSLDPAIFDIVLTQLRPDEAAVAYTNDGLVTFRKAGGAAGTTVVPDLALSLPVPTDRGRTYTFRLREGIRFSNGEEVSPQDVVATFERFLTVKGGDGSFIGDLLVGGSSCTPKHPGACDLSEGVIADEAAGTVSIHLVQPEPELLNILALPMFSIVPAGTPLDLRGEPVQATGPYMITDVGADGSLVLERNPEFEEWSADAQPDGFVDRIEFVTGVELAAQVHLVDRGKSDLTFDGVLPADVEALEPRASDQLSRTQFIGIVGVTLDTRSHPFDRLEARLAVAHALDRGELARIYGPTTRSPVENPVTCQIIPPNIPGFVPYCPFGGRSDVAGSWARPDPSKARALVERSGTGGAQVVVASTPLLEETAKQVVAALVDLGYQAELRVVDSEMLVLDRSQLPPETDVSFIVWGGGIPSPVEFFAPLLGCDAVGADISYNLSAYCDPEIDRRIQRALDIQVTDRYRAAQAFAAIDRDLVDQAPLIPYATFNLVSFVSERVGNVQGNPQLGVLLSQMWVR